MKEIYITYDKERVTISMRGYIVIGRDLHDALNELRTLSEPAYKEVLDYIRNMAEQGKREAVLVK